MVMIKLMMTFCSVHDAVDGVCRSRQPGNDVGLGVVIIIIVCCCCWRRRTIVFGGIILGGKTR